MVEVVKTGPQEARSGPKSEPLAPECRRFRPLRARKPTPGSLEALADRWLAAKQLARRSPASDDARRADLAVIAAILADNANRPDFSKSSSTLVSR